MTLSNIQILTNEQIKEKTLKSISDSTVMLLASLAFCVDFACSFCAYWGSSQILQGELMFLNWL